MEDLKDAVAQWRRDIEAANALVAPVLEQMEAFTHTAVNQPVRWTEEQSAVAGVAGHVRTAALALAHLSDDEWPAPFTVLVRRMEYLENGGDR